VPLLTGHSLLGALTLYSSERAAFTKDHSQFLQIIAPHVAQALSSARRNDGKVQSPSAAAKTELRLVAAR
jgi:GAF domain-containing protein